MRTWPSPEIPELPGRGEPLQLFDTATRELRRCESGSLARMYVCGITPYDATHLGHAATYVAFDLLNRAWRDSGRAVSYAQNVTDVDDPLLERAVALGEDWRELADRETELFRGDMAALRVIAPDHYVGAVESIPAVADYTAALVGQGAAYELGGDLYFDVSAAPGFGAVAGLTTAEMLDLFGERGGDPQRPGKRHPLDCLLWQAARPDEPAWETALGHGRPGWHIECVTIALECLGRDFDVQGGGADLAFPHHEMCAAQARALTGEPLAGHFMHTGMVAYQAEKMSKSLGNLVFVSGLLAAGHDPAAIRLTISAHHYRKGWEYDAAQLAIAEERLARWRAAVALPAAPDFAPVLAELRARLADDLDSPGALDAVDAWATAALADARAGGSSPWAPPLARATTDALLGVRL